MNALFLRSKVLLNVFLQQTGGSLTISVILWQLARNAFPL